MKTILYFDCFSGISGDMVIGALLDLGIDQKIFTTELNKIKLNGYEICIKKDQRNHITGTDFNVILKHEKKDHKNHHDHKHNHNHEHHHRNLNDIYSIIENSDLASAVKKLSKKIFALIAEAEAKVHNKPINEIHFHEVGAIDSIIDIIGTAICINILNPDFIYSSPLPLGKGFADCQHGKIPVPAPATLEILKDIPVYSSGINKELVTPTGAAIIKVLASEFTELPHCKIKKTAYGVGKRQLEQPNLLRVIIGEKNTDKKIAEKLILLETNIDDMNPEIYSYLVPLLMEKGALDVYLTNIIMKKNRPAVKISVLCKAASQNIFEDILYTETSTLGIRKTELSRSCLKREKITINTKYGNVSVKKACHNNREKFAPEFEDCLKLSQKHNVPLKVIYDEVIKNL